jgi:hypothetical protein
MESLGNKKTFPKLLKVSNILTKLFLIVIYTEIIKKEEEKIKEEKRKPIKASGNYSIVSF